MAGLSPAAVAWEAPAHLAAVTYDIVYVRQPRHGDDQHIVWPEVFHPGNLEPGSDLVLLHPDGSEEVLVDTTDGAVTDPFISFDGQSVYYSYFPDVTNAGINPQRGLPYAGADIYRLNLASRQITRLTFQEFEPNTGAGTWFAPNPLNPPNSNTYNDLGYGILNLGPAPVAGGKIVFTSNRHGFVPPKGYTNPTLQLFVMDEDGSNVTAIGPMTIGSALHPTPLQDGRVMFTTFETQGLRDSRNWGLWAIGPDGRHWEPLVSSFKQAGSFHFSTQLSNGDIVVEDYYNLNNFGFGALYRFPVDAPGGMPGFFGADLDDNPPIAQVVGNGFNPGFSYPFRMSFTPRGLYSITPFTNGNDDASPIPPGGGARVGKFTHPSGAPNNDLLVAWSPGPVNALNRPTDLPAADAGLYLIPGGGPIAGPQALVPIKNDPNYNEVWPRAVASYQAVHGVIQPALLAWLPNDGLEHPAELPAGTPFGLIGTSSFYRRESFPGVGDGDFDGLDAFNTSQNDASSNWSWQGADAGRYANADIWAVRIVALEPNTHRSYGPHNGQHFFNHVNEKMRILGEIPLRKFDAQGQPILDPEGNPDTSFLARVPADTPFTFQMLDRNGLVLAMAQTWHQVRPGEARYDCGGCHAHSQQPLAFEDTAAAQPGYAIWDLTQTTPLLTHDGAGDPAIRIENAPAVNVEFYRDIRPLLQTRCVACHTQANPAPPGNLELDDTTLYDIGDFTYQSAPGDYMRLCRDEDARWGYPPLVTVGGDPVWRQTNASRYVRVFQSRRSLLVWEAFGARLDGWTNADHPTESVPGNAATLPPGAQINDADLDFAASAAHPAGVGVTGLTIDEKMTFGRWVDLGCPINTGEGTADENYGWFLDDVRPVLTVSAPRPGLNGLPLTHIRIGLADAYTGIAPGTLSITSTLALAGRAAGAQLADLATPAGDGIYVIALPTPVDNVINARLYAQVADNQGNITRVAQVFSVLTQPLYLPLVGR
jgi:hypothetical protein